MRVVILFVVISALNVNGGDPKYNVENDDSEVICGISDDQTVEFRRAIYDFTLKLFKGLSGHSQGNFVLSTLSIWQTLAAIAEGSNGLARQQLFQLLGLPEDECARKSYYDIAATREPSGPDVSLARTRIFFVDEELDVDIDWRNLALRQFNLLTVPVPIKRAPPLAALSIRYTISAQIAPLNLKGNSVLGDSLDYNGFWTQSFFEVGATPTPFYDHNGHQIGSVDMMRTRKPVRQVFIEQVNANVIEIPVGHDERYRMLFGIPVEGQDIRKSLEIVTTAVIFEIVAGLKESQLRVDVTIPRFLISTEFDVRRLLEELGVNSVWSDASASRNISHPAATPSSFIQRVQITLDSHGVGSHMPEFTEFWSTGSEKIGNEVVINRPFIYGLFDAETYSYLFSGIYFVPTYDVHV